MSQQFPSLNDIEPSWADIQVKQAVLGGGALVNMEDISAINFSDALEVGVKKGTSGGRVKSRTTGEVSLEGSVTFYRSGLLRFLRALIPKAPRRGNQARVSLVGFNVTIQHTPFGSNEIFHTELRGCRYLGATEGLAEGVDADQIECPISMIELVRIIDGVEVVLV